MTPVDSALLIMSMATFIGAVVVSVETHSVCVKMIAECEERIRDTEKMIRQLRKMCES